MNQETVLCFYGSKTTVAAYHPYVVVDYVSHAGVEGWWTYDTLSCGRAGSANIDLFNGNLVVHHADTSTIGSRMPVWKLISGLTVSSYTDEEPVKGEILCVDVTSENGETYSFSVYEYDADSYLIVLSDGRTGFVEADEIDKIVRRIKQFA